MTRLIVHIGDGKAGSTSIQRTLLAGRDRLAAQGVAYLGQSLENCDAREPHAWQVPGGTGALLHRMPPDAAADQIYDTLASELAHLKASGVKAAIWSNEALFARNEPVISALTRLKADGVALQIVLFLRRHDTWARSAYAQWGIRHKAYEGPVKPFRDWIEHRPVEYADDLTRWDAELGEDLILRNFEEVDSVVPEFLAIAGLTDLTEVRAYETPAPELLLAWAVYNSRFDGEVTPKAFGRVLTGSQMQAGAHANLPQPSDLLPNSADLGALLDASQEDLAMVNEVFKRHGQPPFNTESAVDGVAPPDPWALLQLTMSMLFSVQEQVLALKRRIREFEEGR